VQHFVLLDPTSTVIETSWVAFVCKFQVCVHLIAIWNMQCGSSHIQLCSLNVGCFSNSSCLLADTCYRSADVTGWGWFSGYRE